MARLAILIDRLPEDPSWKGAYLWQVVRALADSQHDVTVFTTEDPERVGITHARLTVARPASHFGVDKMGRWTQALLTLRPHIIHTFALNPTPRWPTLSVWPYLDSVCRLLPEVRRVSTFFDRSDLRPRSPEWKWHLGSHAWTVFSPTLAATASTLFSGPIDIAPVEDLAETPHQVASAIDPYLFVAAPVSEWRDRESGLSLLTEFLSKHKDLVAHINGGWGELSLNERRRGWQSLNSVSTRVRLLAPQSLASFAEKVAGASRLWLEGVAADSWRYQVSTQMAQALGKELIGAREAGLGLANGSTANFLSRLYLR